MADYNNPGALLPANTFQFAGPLGGYVAGMGLADYQNAQDQARQAQALQYLRDLNQYKNEQAQSPMLQAQYQLGTQKANTENQSLYQSGLQGQVLQSGAQADISGNEAKQSTAQTTKRFNQQNAAYSLNEELKAAQIPGDPLAMSDQDRANYKAMKARYSDVLPNLPDVPDKNFQWQLNNYASTALANPEFIQKRALLQEENKGKQQVATTTGEYHLQGIKSENEARLAIANTAVGRSVERAKENLRSGNFSQGDVDLVKEDMAIHTLTAIMGSLPVKLSAMDAQDKQALYSTIQDGVENTFNAIYGKRVGAMGAGSGSGGPAAQPNPNQGFTNPQDAVKAATGQSDGWTTSINGVPFIKQGGKLVKKR